MPAKGGDARQTRQARCAKAVNLALMASCLVVIQQFWV